MALDIRGLGVAAVSGVYEGAALGLAFEATATSSSEAGATSSSVTTGDARPDDSSSIVPGRLSTTVTLCDIGDTRTGSCPGKPE